MKSFVLLLTLMLGAVLLHLPATGSVYAQQGSAQRQGLLTEACKRAPDSAACKDAARQTRSNENPAVRAINKAANLIALLTGVAAVIMIIIGGLTMAVSAGNAEKVAKSRRRVVYSLIGLAVVALAWAATRFITDRVLQ